MNLGISYSKSNRSSCHYEVRMQSSGEKRKVLISVKQNMFSQCCTLTPVSISNTEGCLQSGEVSHAVGYTAKETRISNKRLRKQLKDLYLDELGKRSLSQMPIEGIEY